MFESSVLLGAVIGFQLGGLGVASVPQLHQRFSAWTGRPSCSFAENGLIVYSAKTSLSSVSATEALQVT